MSFTVAQRKYDDARMAVERADTFSERKKALHEKGQASKLMFREDRERAKDHVSGGTRLKGQKERADRARKEATVIRRMVEEGRL